ncbi:hypothetical protein NDU88_004448 [Pleurodeles waltl]|uniref:Uncharacterized protein n=1 Tax=Pleurodeles waltl TaxID=8319 RepID=A0AAV7WYA5_PLEWA|nr:hypothetical protein NDU88_004448 [Pleurodeles waltl]
MPVPRPLWAADTLFSHQRQLLPALAIEGAAPGPEGTLHRTVRERGAEAATFRTAISSPQAHPGAPRPPPAGVGELLGVVLVRHRGSSNIRMD